MYASFWLRSAAACAAVVVFGLCWLLVPTALWTQQAMVAAALLAVSIPLPMLVVGSAVRRPGRDATVIWSIGPTSVYWVLLLGSAGASLAFAFQGLVTLGWAAGLVWLGVAVVGWLLLRASTDVVARAATQTGSAAADPRAKWMSLLRQFELLIGDDVSRALVADLRERIRFAANEGGQVASGYVEGISVAVASLESVLSNTDELKKLVAKVRVLLDERESALRSARSRA
jgi:hypothetical protein